MPCMYCPNFLEKKNLKYQVSPRKIKDWEVKGLWENVPLDEAIGLLTSKLKKKDPF